MSRAFVRLVALINFAVLAAATTVGQTRETGNISGQVRYANGNVPAFNVLVSCDAYSGGLIAQENTDRNGKFHFHVSLDQYVITIRVPGYIEARETVELQKSPDQYLDIRLRPDGSGAPATPPRAVLNANVPPDAQQEFYKADAAFAGGSKQKTEEGIKHLEKAIAIYPKFLEAELRLGTAYMDLQQWDQAEQALRKALEIDPKTVNASFALGEIYLRHKKYDEAEKVLQQGLSVEPKSARAHLALARVYWEKVAGVKDETQWRPSLEKSYQEVRQAVELDPNLAEAHLLKGNLYFKVRRAEDALHEFEAYLRLDPKGSSAEQTRAMVDKIRKALAETKRP